MALNIKNLEVERLAAEVAGLAGESKTEAIRRADRGKRERLERLLRLRIWPEIPPEVLGRPLSKREREEILGYGPDGV